MQNAAPTLPSRRPRLGISSCLLGNRVRYDGQHKLDPFLVDVLGALVEWVPVCPEVECGMGVPREAMRLVGKPEAPRLMTRRTGRDLTGLMSEWIPGRLAELETKQLCGFVFKSDSPSSGMERVKVHGGGVVRHGVGLFARAFLQAFPRLPAEEEGRLHDAGLRENFIERIFTVQRWNDATSSGLRIKNLVDFHTRNKLLLLAHSTRHYQALGRLVATAEDRTLAHVFGEYEALLTEGMKLKATPRKNANVLQHILGYFKRQLSPDEKSKFQDTIDAYRRGDLPLIVPITLITHYVRKYEEHNLALQTYLNPYPAELPLPNHA